jgi:hypothetical protein
MNMLSNQRNLVSAARPYGWSLAIAALMGATMLASPLQAARADVGKPIILVQDTTTQPAAPAMKRAMAKESVETRITDLHTSLKITPDEESKWNDVAQAMRDNEKANQDLAAKWADKGNPASMTAVQDLDRYQAFAQAHADGLKNLTSAFNSLYKAMPDAQKKNADMVFNSARQERHAAAASSSNVK